MRRVCFLFCLPVVFTCAVLTQQTTRPATAPATQPATAQSTRPATQPDNAQRDDDDPKAVAVAERVMKRLGGESAWTQTRYIRWNFFGARTHTWDKHAMRDRIEYTDRDGKSYLYIIDLDNRTGRVWIDGSVITDDLRLAELMDSAYAMWVNAATGW